MALASPRCGCLRTHRCTVIFTFDPNAHDPVALSDTLHPQSLHHSMIIALMAGCGAGGATKRSRSQAKQDPLAADVLHACATALHTQTDVLILRLAGHCHVHSSPGDAGSSRKARRTLSASIGAACFAAEDACVPNDMAPLPEPVRHPLTPFAHCRSVVRLWVMP